MQDEINCFINALKDNCFDIQEEILRDNFPLRDDISTLEIQKYGALYAAAYGDVELLKTIINLVGPIDFDMCDEKGRTLVMHASTHGNIKVLTYLIQQGASVKKSDIYNMCALQLLAESDLIDEDMASVAESLLAAGAEPNYVTKDGLHTLMHFVKKNTAFEITGDKIFKTLIKHG